MRKAAVLSNGREDQLMIQRWVHDHLRLDDASVAREGRREDARREIALALSSLRIPPRSNRPAERSRDDLS